MNLAKQVINKINESNGKLPKGFPGITDKDWIEVKTSKDFEEYGLDEKEITNLLSKEFVFTTSEDSTKFEEFRDYLTDLSKTGIKVKAESLEGTVYAVKVNYKPALLAINGPVDFIAVNV